MTLIGYTMMWAPWGPKQLVRDVALAEGVASISPSSATLIIAAAHAEDDRAVDRRRPGDGPAQDQLDGGGRALGRLQLAQDLDEDVNDVARGAGLEPATTGSKAA
jgi:hypothetical protein